jgi:hypothetical protein
MQMGGTVNYQFGVKGYQFSITRDVETGNIVAKKYVKGAVQVTGSMFQSRFLLSRDPITDEEMEIVYKKIKSSHDRGVDNRPENERPVWRRDNNKWDYGLY